MATVTGTSGNDVLTGTGGDDHIVGLGGHDSLVGLEGNDTLEGGDGDDSISDGVGDDLAEGGEGDDYFSNTDGSDTLNGGGGDDRFSVVRGSGQSGIVTMSGGVGRDELTIRSIGTTDFIVDAGDGDDLIRIDTYKGDHLLTLGAGSDTVAVVSPLFFSEFLTTTITDFTVGAAGDRLDFSDFFAVNMSLWDGSQNPFALGFIRLVQDNDDAVIEIDQDGGGDSYVEYIRLAGVDAADLTYHNLDGFPADGSIPAGLTLDGTEGRDILVGAAGDDSLSGLGEDDVIYGGAGGDTILGGDGHDSLFGEWGDDIIEGGAGVDQLTDGFGDDIVRGGADADIFRSHERGNDLLEGEGGDDYFDVRRGGDYQVTVDGGDGNDLLNITAYNPGNLFIVIGGAGNDIVNVMTMSGTAQISLGAGADEISLAYSDWSLLLSGHLIVSDFETGAGGDRLDFDRWLTTVFTWDQATNPFQSGHLQLVQNGTDTLLQADGDGGGDNWRTVATFTNREVSAFTPDNLDGFAADGSAPAGVTLIGTAAGETLTGTAGNDRIEGRGGADRLEGMGGADLIIAGDWIDWIEGGTGDDRVEAGGGDDYVNGGAGDDEVYGGEGNDTVYVNDGADTVWAGAGDDNVHVQISPPAGKTTAVHGEAGADHIRLMSSNAGTHIVADGGEGSDRIEIGDLHGTAAVTLGGGADRIMVLGNAGANGEPGQVTITDFASGAGGDLIDLAGSLGWLLLNWDGSNPFATGHVRLVQQGGDTLLRIDRDGSGSSHDFVTVFTLAGVGAGTLTADNLGYPVPAVYGSAGDDQATGGAGNDFLLLQQGGDDEAAGGGGNDVLYFGTAFIGADVADGGAGRDAIVLQGHYALTLSETNLAGIESLSIQSGANTKFGDTANNFYDFDITTADGNVAAGQQLIVNASSLRAGEDFTFDGSAETDGRFLVYGGHGVDDLTGGDGVDVFFFEGQRWGPDDRVDGGDGRDALVISAGSGLTHIEFGPDALANIESISLNKQFATDPSQKPSYELVLDNGNVAPGGTLIVNGNSLVDPTQTVGVDGSGVHDGNLFLLGGAGKDTLIGGDGADILYGAGRLDHLTGGGGSDTFQFRDTSESTMAESDHIFDFEAGLDRIDLGQIDADTTQAGNQAFTFIGSAAFGNHAGELRVVDMGQHQWVVMGDTNGDGMPDFWLGVTRTDASPMVASDFLV